MDYYNSLVYENGAVLLLSYFLLATPLLIILQMDSVSITMLRYHNKYLLLMKWLNALLYQIYWWQVDVHGKRNVIDWIIYGFFLYFQIFFTALYLFLEKYEYIRRFGWEISTYITVTFTIISTVSVSIYMLWHHRYRKIFTNHDAYDTSWARNIFRTYIISAVFFLSLWYIIPTSK